MHGHTWRVRCFWTYDGSSIDGRKALLDKVIVKLDHSVLPDELAHAENIAAHIADLTDAVKVLVWREAEDIGAEWPG